MFERFTDRARRVVVFAQEESRMLGHDRIGSGHLLLGVLRDRDSPTVQALERAGISVDVVRARLLEQWPAKGRAAQGGHVPFTPGAKKVLESGMTASQRLGGQSIDTPHLLRAMIDVGESMANRLLTGLDTDMAALARTADDLARSESRLGAAAPVRPSPRITRSGSSTASLRGDPRVPASLLADEIAELAKDLTRRHDRLLAALQHYGRHRDGCEPTAQRACSCGLDRALADADVP